VVVCRTGESPNFSRELGHRSGCHFDRRDMMGLAKT
jgi:hypothetical protein